MVVGQQHGHRRIRAVTAGGLAGAHPGTSTSTDVPCSGTLLTRT
jgi:hypothetical protein